MKKTLVSILMVLVLLCGGNVWARELTAEQKTELMDLLIDPIHSDDEVVRRRSCLATIMKAIGATEDRADQIGGELTWQGIFFSDRHDYFSPGYVVDESFAWYEGNYIALAEAIGVARGIIQDDGHLYFYPLKEAAIRDALSFMLRCLKLPDNWEERPLYEVAYETGLLQEEDAFARNMDENLTYGTLRTLTERFLKQERHLYFTFTWVEEGESWGLWAYAKKDEEGTQTYEEVAYTIHLTTDLYEPVKLYINQDLMEENDAFWKPIPCLAIRPVIEKIGGTVEWTPEEITIRYGEKVFACRMQNTHRRTFKYFMIRDLSGGRDWEETENIIISNKTDAGQYYVVLNQGYFETGSVSSILSRIGYSLIVDEEKREIYINRQP